jgi:hypothetical protein
MRLKLLMPGVALALTVATGAARAENVTLNFYGQITQIQPGLETQTNAKVGDSFVLALEFTPSGPTPALGYYLAGGTQAISPETVTSRIAPYTGMGLPYADTYFKDPAGYRMYCQAYARLSNSLLSFAMLDESVGAWGSVAVGQDFPSDWFSNWGNPLPNGATELPFTASGEMSFNFTNGGGANLKGDITSASVSREALAYAAAPVPEPASLAVLILGATALWRRRRPR